MSTRKTDPTLIALGERISEQRRKRKITLGELSQQMNISKGNLSDIENGKKDPRYCTLRAIAAGLGMDVAQLVKRLP